MEDLLDITLKALNLAINQATPFQRKPLEHAYELVRREHHAIHKRDQSTRETK